MAKAAFVTYLTILSITLTSAYQSECAVGPEYWCKSFSNAESCGALRHCTDTVWRYDAKSTRVESTSNCEWCQKILEGAHQGIQHLATNEDLIREKLEKDCQLFPFENLQSKCSNALKTYGASVGSLMKYKRYATLCHLMDICSSEPVADVSTTEKSKILGQNRCTWGPSYWCSSLSNTRECQSIEHCSTRVWSQQALKQTSKNSVCQYCEYTINKLRTILETAENNFNTETWLAGACSMLATKDAIDSCQTTLGQYAKEVHVLIEKNIKADVICQLAHMCSEATTVETPEEEPKVIEYVAKHMPIDEQSKMLCQVLVQATSELHFNQQKSRNEIQDFLKIDCQKLDNQQLVDKCEHIVDKHGLQIHGHVASHIEPAKICDYLEDFSDQSIPQVHCELCSFVLSVAKYMIDAKQSQERIVEYIDEQICARLTGSLKVNCRQMIETNSKRLIDSIECGTKPMLLCTHFQVCIDQVPTSISKDDKNEFLKENICDQLGTFKSACHAFLDRDSNRLMQTMANDMDGDVLCRIFGICPKKLSFLDDLSVRDDTNKCKRCIADFTRRKHIAEKLVNRSGEFLHHLCGQLPQKDECIKTVDESLDALGTFVRSLDPQNICETLNFCNKTSLSLIQPEEIVIQEEVVAYVKKEICSKTGSLREMCERTIDAEGPAIIKTIANNIDPKQVCEILGICTKTSLFDNCNDKCECCLDKIDTHQNQLNTFFKGMIGSIQTLCEHTPNNQQCLQMTNQLKTNLDKITEKFNSKQVCQGLQHCSSSPSTLPIEIESLSQCQIRINSKKDFLLSAISSINENLKSLCEYIPWNKDCYPIIDRSTIDIKDKLSQLDSESICTSKQSLADVICTKSGPFEKLCQQLVQFDENSKRTEGIFRSMFNLNGEIDQELCELKGSPCQKFDSCSHCQEFSTKSKTYNLNTIETIRNGLLATCDWSLTKDYCNSWFNRVSDRLKDKVDKFQVENFCQQTNLCQKQVDTDPCQRCKTHFLTQTNRFRKIVSEITNSLTSLCTTNDCRSLVQSTQQQTLSQIDRIDPSTYCERYGYCLEPTTSYMAHLLANPSRRTGVLNSGFNDRLEIAIRQDICFQYGQFRPMCEHLMASKQAHRFNYIYMSLLKNNPKLVDDDLREQLETQPTQDLCDSCKQTVQTSIDFWKNSLESVRNVLLRTCQHCSAKEQCEKYYNQRFDNLQTYLNNFNVEQFCQNVHLCSTSNVVVVDSSQCSTCIERLDNRRNALSQTVNRLADYFTELCRQFAPKQCQTFVQQIQTSFQQSIDEFDAKKTCHAIGFCSTEDHQMDFDVYEKHLIENLQANFCEHLGPFESLCKQTLQGNRKQIQTVKINFNIKDVMQIGEQFSKGSTRNFLSAANLAECERDKCQCCINRINQKKDCWKNFGDKLFNSFSQTCSYCPAKQQCQQYWQTQQTQFDDYINNIDAKQICTRLGYCNASTLCSNMGIFQQACEDALNKFTQSTEHDRNQLEQHLPHTSIVVLPTADNEHELTKDSNSTCILCEFVMNILSNYIHQKSTEQEIEQSLQKICLQMPRTLQQQCHELVENYGPPIIAILIQEFNLKFVCRKLNLCTGQMKVDLTHVNKPSTSACSVCDYVSTYIDFTLKRDPSEKSLQHGLATVCTHLSQIEKQQCETLIQLFTPNIRQMNLALGKNFCQQLPICQAENTVTIESPSINRVPSQTPSLTKEEQDLKKKVIENLDETPQCVLCHYVITYLAAVIKSNQSEEAIEAALGKVCTILPKKERAQCEQFVKTYGPVLAELISESADPDTICRYLGMCQMVLPKETSTPSQPVTYPNHDYVRLSDEQVTYQCTICQYLIGRMRHFVQENQTEEEILASLKKSCTSFSVVNLQQQCENFLDQYGSYIIQMVASDVQPKVACQNLGLCQKDTYIQSLSTKRQSTPPTPAASSSYGKCIFGISYWCTSRQNAELCNAVQLCENQVWSKKNKNIVI